MAAIKKNLPIVISLVIAVVAGLLIYSAVRSMSPTIPVVVAKENVMVGQEITKESLTVMQYPKSMVPGTSFGSIEQVVGKAVLNGPIIAGNMVRAENITDDSSLRAALDSFISDPGWTAVELPPGGALGMASLRRGDKVDIYSEIGNDQGMVVGLVCSGAVILDKPVKDQSQQFIVAVPKEYAPAVAELIIRAKPMTLTLNNYEETTQTQPPSMSIQLPEEGDRSAEGGQ